MKKTRELRQTIVTLTTNIQQKNQEISVLKERIKELENVSRKD